jgi:hypothetical protein
MNSQFSKGISNKIDAAISNFLSDVFTNQTKKNPSKAYRVRISPAQNKNICINPITNSQNIRFLKNEVKDLPLKITLLYFMTQPIPKSEEKME